MIKEIVLSDHGDAFEFEREVAIKNLIYTLSFRKNTMQDAWTLNIKQGDNALYMRQCACNNDFLASNIEKQIGAKMRFYTQDAKKARAEGNDFKNEVVKLLYEEIS